MCANYNEEKYKILYTAYADEIRNLWQRSVFLGAFMSLAWGGYGALQLKLIDNASKIPATYHYASLGLCAVIIVLSLLWVAMAKGSKFVQEAHEEHIKNLNYDLLEQTDTQTNKPKRLFCDLDYYQAKLEKKNKLSFWKPLGIYRFSPSKINIALGWVSFIVSFVLLNAHLLIVADIANRIKQHFHSLILWIAQYAQCGNTFLIFICLCPFIFVGFVTLLIRFTLKSNLGGGAGRK